MREMKGYPVRAFFISIKSVVSLSSVAKRFDERYRERQMRMAFLPSDGLDRVAGAAELVVAAFDAACGDDERVLAAGNWLAKDDLGVVRVGFE